MKYFFTLILLTFISFQCFPQRNPDLKFGIGIPYAFGNIKSDDIISVNKSHIITGFPSLSVEKPIGFGIPREKKFSINPGLSYFFFTDKETHDNYDQKLNHHSLNIYSKWLYQMKVKRRSEAFLYFGAVTGIHIFTKTHGTTSYTTRNPDDPNAGYDDNKSGINFYDAFYYGGILGFQPNAKVTQTLKPSFEIKFYPGLVTRNTIGNSSKQSTIEFTVMLGYRK